MMSSQKKIVVIVDNDDQTDLVVARATEIAEALNSPMVLLSCIYDPYIAGKRFSDSEGLKQLRKDLLDHELEGLEQLAADARRRGLQISSRVVWDTPRHEAVCRQADLLDAQMLVTGTHKHSLLEQTVFSNSEWQLLRTASCPVFLVRKLSYSENALIYAAVDPLHQNDKPADLDDRLIRWGQELEQAIGGEFHLIHVVDDIDTLAAFAATGMMPTPMGDGNLQKELEAAHKKHLRGLGDSYGIDPRRLHQETGFASKILVEEATSANADLVILGAVSRSRIRQAVLGNTAERVMEGLPCDMLVVKPHWFESPVDEKTDLEFHDSTDSNPFYVVAPQCAQS